MPVKYAIISFTVPVILLIFQPSAYLADCKAAIYAGNHTVAAHQSTNRGETVEEVPVESDFSISDLPLETISKGSPANIMFVFDDSGSMLWEMMTPGEDQGLFDGYHGLFEGHKLPENRRMEWKSQWFGYNRMYYNPGVYYRPWPGVVDLSAAIHAENGNWDRRLSANADMYKPRLHPLKSDSVLEMDATFATVSTVDQSQPRRKGANIGRAAIVKLATGEEAPSKPISEASSPLPAGLDQAIPPGQGVEIPNAHYYVWSSMEEAPYLIVFDKNTASVLYYRGSGTNIDSRVDNRDDVVSGLIPVVDPPDDVRIKGSYMEARQNFANWFAYYRQRRLAAVAALARVITEIEGIRVGVYSIHGRIVTPVQPVKLDGVDHSDVLLKALYGSEAGGATPLRRALEDVGRYYDATNNDPTPLGNKAPWAVSSEGGDCQQSFAVVMTDGYWNSDGARSLAVQRGDDHVTDSDGDGDGDAEDRDSEGHFLYRSSQSDTLADVAMYYYAKDLDTSLENSVVNSPRLTLAQNDKADWQHMVTFCVSFGVKGTLDMTAYNLHADDPNRNFPDWPVAIANRATTIDDLFHAAVNGHGAYLSAADPDQLVNTFKTILQTISRKTCSAAPVTINGDEMFETIGSELRMYQSEYHTDNWHGDLKSYSVKIVDGALESTPIWSASDSLEMLFETSAYPAARKIISSNGFTGIPFKWNELSERQKKHLSPYFSPQSSGEHLLEYLKGNRQLELSGEFRTRTKPLGDLVHSQPQYVDYGGGKGIIYIGGNDGMLHGFDAGEESEGREIFAFVPSFVYPNLRELANNEYNHRFYVDGTPFAQRINEELVLLVGGLGKGGKGIYALDISNPDEFDQNGVLWEYPLPSKLALSGNSFSFVNRGGTGYDEIRDADGRLSVFSAGDFIAVAGALCNDLQPGSNDGTYQVLEAEAGTVRLPAGSLINGCGDKSSPTIYKSTSDPSMGYSFSRPILVRSNDPSINAGTDLSGWVVIFGNGYMSERGTAVLYILNPLNGEVLRKIDTETGPFNGLSTPKVTDVDRDLRADYVYAGDLLGNMWKFDLTAGRGDQADPHNPDLCAAGKPCHRQWQVAFCDENTISGDCNSADATPMPLFTAKANQPITASPDIMHHSLYPGHMVIFGTGRYLGEKDLEVEPDMVLQSVYGVWDWAPDIYDQGYLGCRQDESNRAGLVTTLSHAPWRSGAAANTLLRQEMLQEGVLTEDSDGDGNIDTVVDDRNGNGVKDADETVGKDGNFDVVNEDANGNENLDVYGYFRIPTNYEGSWKIGQASIDVDGDGVITIEDQIPLGDLGWYFDLPGRIMDEDGLDNDNDGNVDESGERSIGERVINESIIRDGLAITISFGLTGENCSIGAYSFINERNADTGGMPGQPVMDLSGSGPDEQGDNEVNAGDTVFIVDDRNTTEVLRGHPADKGVMGQLQKPVILREGDEADPDPEEFKIMTKDNGDREVLVEKAERRGIYYWQQVQ